MCLLSDAELNCVSTNILCIPEFKQFEIGISTNLYFPAIGTAGFERVCVSGANLEPWPPPRITPNTFSVMFLLYLVQIYIFLRSLIPGMIQLHHKLTNFFYSFTISIQ